MASSKYTKRNVDRDLSAVIDTLAAAEGVSSTKYLEKIIIGHITKKRGSQAL